MISRRDQQPSKFGREDFDARSGKDRRKMLTMLNPDMDRRKKDRRRRIFRVVARMKYYTTSF